MLRVRPWNLDPWLCSTALRTWCCQL